MVDNMHFKNERKIIIKKYLIYVHVFPDKKRYIGTTCINPRARWNGGFGYHDQKLMFGAVTKYGWNNVRHYILMEGLSKDDALLYEAAFIYQWQTYKKSKGYNTICPEIAGMKDIIVPNLRSCNKRKVEDYSEQNINNRCLRVSTHKDCKKVRCKENDMVYQNVSEAAARSGVVGASPIYRAISSGHASGTCRIVNERGVSYEVPAHWEYV